MPPSMEHVLVDQSVLFKDPDIINRIRGKNGLPFVAHNALLELRSLTKGNGQIHQNARRFFRSFVAQPSRPHRALPKGTALHDNDLLAECAFDGQPIFALKRTTVAVGSTVDAVDLCLDYDLLLLTCDEAQLQQCEAAQARAIRWTGPSTKAAAVQKAAAQKAPASPKSAPAAKAASLPKAAAKAPSVPIKPFDLPAKPLNSPDRKIHNTGATVKQGSVVSTALGRQLTLDTFISAGGEGTIYAVAGTREVCKIYHPDNLTTRRREKIELMVTRRIDAPGICWPTELVFNAKEEFVGYVMPRAQGKTLTTSVFLKPLLMKNFPTWTRRDLVNVAIAFLKQVQYLHSLNIIIGDINPMNLLVTPDSNQVWIVDTDSFQIGHFPCEVGTVPFTAPEIQGEKYGNYLRSKNHELFAVATMLFMILLPGKPPYSQQGGGTAADNIRNMNFPYRFKKDSGKGKVSVTPVGMWQNIWSHLPYPLKQAFSNTFEDNQRRPISDWLALLEQYGKDLCKGGKHSDELFPQAFHIADPAEAVCGGCKKTYTESKKWLDKMKSASRSTRCADCQKAAKLKKLAEESRKDTEQAVQRPAPPPAPAPRPTPAPVRNIPAPAPAPKPVPKPVAAPMPPPARPAPPRPAPQPQRQPTAPRAQPHQSAPIRAPRQESIALRWLKRLLKRFL
ncbi:hypothetical protein JFU47_22390 [Pseudomonas sp. TH39(2020)]|uniref:protein kinase domain-containing protein n=1 Tax=Pseudomonas sp. TH39(2020) TaxID=2796349 RepID=UPI00191333C3|nr:hypothetical protein [Pseudomonas sp. TH39(2020)]MBK5399434.1 hypothetical protein [Pseudomonas sp. TH39(2020)]